MSEERFRRDIITTAGTILASALGGCSALGASKEVAHYIDMFNYDESRHTFNFLVKNQDGHDICDKTEILNKNTATEKLCVFTGTPDVLTLTVDSEKATQYRWPNTSCKEEGYNSAGGLSLYFTPERQFQIVSKCETIHVED